MVFAGAESGIAAWVLVLAGLAAGAGLVALGVWALPRLRGEEQGYPLEAQIEEALLPLAFEGICAAYKLSEKAMDELGARIDGTDKKQIADVIYDLLPDQIGKFPLSIVKSLVPRERFEELIQDAFDRFHRDYTAFGDRYHLLFEAWKEDWHSQDADEEAMAAAMTAGSLLPQR